MRLDIGQARRLFAAQPVARLATVNASGVPHLVPVTFALDGNTIVFAVDSKPKATTELRRLRNIAANPNVSFLADHYDDDWSRLWWVRADGTATILQPKSDSAAEADLALLAGKYPHYQRNPPHGPIVRTTVTTWRGWAASTDPG